MDLVQDSVGFFSGGSKLFGASSDKLHLQPRSTVLCEPLSVWVLIFVSCKVPGN